MEQDSRLTFHPYRIMLFLILAGLTILFLGFSAAYLYNLIQQNIPPLKIPTIFLFNTLILLASSGMIILANRYYLNDETNKYKTALLVTILLTFVFMAAQYLGWQQLLDQNRTFQSDNSSAYLYLLSGLHFVHVFAGLPFLILFFITAIQKMKEPTSVLIYFSDPLKRLKLKLLTIYWHFIDILWIYLVLFFSLVYFFR